LSDAIQAQATVMTYSDLYWVFGVALLLMMPLVLLLRPLPRDAKVSVGA
jgi:DHA2 family multidrug resistance protein